MKPLDTPPDSAEQDAPIPPIAPGFALLSPKRTAGLVGVAVSTLTRWRRTEGAGPPFVRVSANRVGYPVEGLRRWVETRTER